MKKSIQFLAHQLLVTLTIFALFVGANAFASGGGGGGEGGGAYEKMEPYTVNLKGLMQVVQVSATLKLAKPDASAKVKLYMPQIRHEMLILLGSKTAADIESVEGKQKLIKQMRGVANKVVGLNTKEGVAEVLLEQIIIQ